MLTRSGILGILPNVTDAFERKIPIVKQKRLVIVPTTCGTGSEVTNISIAELKARHTKLGLADSVIATQQRLLGNNYVPLSREEILNVYKELF